MPEKKLWIINHYASSPLESAHTRHFDLARNIYDSGWETWIFAASVEMNTQRQRLEKHEQVRTEDHANVHFRWINTPGYLGNGLGRIFNMIVFSWRMLLTPATQGLEAPSVIIGSSVHPLAAASAALLAKRHRVPFIFEVRDIWPETLIALGYTHKYSPLAITLRLIEKWLCRQSCRIISAIPGYNHYLAERDIKAPDFVYIPNGVNLDNIGKTLPYKKQNPFHIVYLGAHGNANDLKTLIKAMEIVEVSHGITSIECHLIGVGPLKPALMDYCAARRLKQIFFHAPVKKSDIASVADNTQAFVLCGRKLPTLYKYGISMNKIPDYLAMGRPVIIAIESANNPIMEAGAGVCVQPECPEELAGAIIKMAGMDEDQLQEIGHRGRCFAEAIYDMKILAKQLLGVLDEVMDE